MLWLIIAVPCCTGQGRAWNRKLCGTTHNACLLLMLNDSFNILPRERIPWECKGLDERHVRHIINLGLSVLNKWHPVCNGPDARACFNLLWSHWIIYRVIVTSNREQVSQHRIPLSSKESKMTIFLFIFLPIVGIWLCCRRYGRSSFWVGAINLGFNNKSQGGCITNAIAFAFVSDCCSIN